MILSSEHEAARKIAREFAERYVEPVAEKMDRELYYPRDVIREAGKLGLLAPTVPAEYGGGGADLRTAVVVLEEVGRISGGMSLIMAAIGTLFADTLAKYGSARQKEEVLARVASGDAVGAFALSEPCCGSDAAAIQTSAKREGGEWAISGRKMWITNGHYADYFLVAARTGPREAKHKAITLFLLKRGPCIETTPIEVMGSRGSGTAEVKLEDCRAGDDDIVGGLNKGFDAVMRTLDVGRTTVSAMGLGVMRGAYEEALDWARRRELFGQRLVDFQWAQFELAEIYATIEAARALTYYAAYLFDVRDPAFVLYTHVVKLLVGRWTVDVVRRAVHLEGGFGYSKDSRAERFYRDARLLEIGEGTNEVMKYVLYKIIEKGLPKFEF
ncbi:MAG: acyl-CoA dehydrogenase family protein [Thermoproteus sp.]|nr:acyl-CoA dehydrogenase family protein [Thermoproteus sp.]